jgi:simple sugar transport system ATP-binding protein
VLGDNGAGKSTLIKIISGLHQHDAGVFRIEGESTALGSPREALDRGIATVYQDLAVVSLMPVWRNFFLGSEPTRGKGPFKRLDVAFMRETTRTELLRMGIDLRDVDQPIGTLSGGERQCVAIARAVYFGAKVLVLDEPTAALGVKQSGVVLKYVAAARDAGLGVVLITHNPHHAYLVGNRFVLLKRGAMAGSHTKDEIGLDELTRQMAGRSWRNSATSWSAPRHPPIWAATRWAKGTRRKAAGPRRVPRRRQTGTPRKGSGPRKAAARWKGSDRGRGGGVNGADRGDPAAQTKPLHA